MLWSIFEYNCWSINNTGKRKGTTIWNKTRVLFTDHCVPRLITMSFHVLHDFYEALGMLQNVSFLDGALYDHFSVLPKRANR